MGARTPFRPAAIVLALAAYFYFLLFFAPRKFDASVDLAWLIAIVLWTLAWWRSDAASAPRLRQPWSFYLLYVAVLTPFAANWRWAITGDSLDWPDLGIDFADSGPTLSFLSARGAQQFTYLQTQLHNSFMLLIAPTIFWHRFGQILVGAGALAAIFTVYARLVGPRFGLLVAGCTMSTTVIVAQTYISYPHIDGLAIGHVLLAITLWIHRDPASRRAWLLLGLCSGLALYLTPNSWFMAACVWIWLAVVTVRQSGSLPDFILAAGTGMLVGLPLLSQWLSGSDRQLFSLLGSEDWNGPRLANLLWQSATIPFQSEAHYCGAFGPQLPPLFRWLFPFGFLFAVVVRPTRHARLMAAIYMVHVVLLALAQGPGAGEVSIKRALVLVPLAVYFVFLPFERWLRSLPVVLGILSVWASFAVYNLAFQVEPGRLGDTLLDGVVEIHQRASDVPVCIYETDDGRALAFEPGGDVARLYQLIPHVRRLRSIADIDDCGVLCFDVQNGTVANDNPELVSFPLHASIELRCFRRLRSK